MSAQLGKDIAAARHKAKLSGKQLAERVGVSDGWVRQLETGRMKKPNPQKLAAVATELGMSVHTVLAMTDQLGADLTPEPASGDALLERQVRAAERQADAAEEANRLQAEQNDLLRLLLLRDQLPEDHWDEMRARGLEWTDAAVARLLTPPTPDPRPAQVG